MNAYVYSVGQRYHPSLTSVPEGMHITHLSSKGMQILVAFARLTDAEVEGFKKDPITVAIAAQEELLIVMAKCSGSNGWMDAPYDIRLLPEKNLLPPFPSAQMAHWLLVEAETGIIRAIRVASMSKEIMRGAHDVISKQLQSEFDRLRYDRLVDRYLAYSRTDLA